MFWLSNLYVLIFYIITKFATMLATLTVHSFRWLHLHEFAAALALTQLDLI